MKTPIQKLGRWLVAVCVTTPAFAQTTTLTLRQCLDIAQRNNPQVRQAQIQVEADVLQNHQAKLNRLPSVGLFGSQAFSAGRNINPTTNQFIDQQVRSNNYQLSGSLTVFNGMALTNAIRQTSLVAEASKQGLLAARQLVALSVVQNYLAVLTAEDQLANARRQVETSRAQVQRTQFQVNAGTVAEATLLDLQAQLANDELAVVNARNTLYLAKLTLLQALNEPNTANNPDAVLVERIPEGELAGSPYPQTVQQVYETALSVMPAVKSAELRVRSEEMGVKVARSGLYPTLSLTGGLTTLYSSVGLQRFIPDGTTVETASGGYVLLNGVQQPVYSSSPGGRYENYSYGDQLQNNLYRSVSLNLRIPIFSNFQARNRITSALLLRKTAEVALDNARIQLRQGVEQAYATLLTAADRYRATAEQVRALERTFQATESRFNNGTIPSVDYVLAKNRLDNARLNLVQARYETALRAYVLDLYQGKAID
jgi:outer membrane protein